MGLTDQDLNTLQTLVLVSVGEWGMKLRGYDGLEGQVVEKIRAEFQAERDRLLELNNRIGEEKWRRENPRF